MDHATVPIEPLEQRTIVAKQIMALPPQEQFSTIERIIGNVMTAVEGQDVAELNDTLQIVVTQAEAFTLLSVHGQTTEEMNVRRHQAMTVAATEHPHIVRDPRIGWGEPIIVGTGVRVRILVEYWRAGTPPEDLLLSFPHLTLAQVFDALSYYQDHQNEMNTLIAQNRVDPALLHESVRRHS